MRASPVPRRIRGRFRWPACTSQSLDPNLYRSPSSLATRPPETQRMLQGASVPIVTRWFSELYLVMSRRFAAVRTAFSGSCNCSSSGTFTAFSLSVRVVVGSSTRRRRWSPPACCAPEAARTRFAPRDSRSSLSCAGVEISVAVFCAMTKRSRSNASARTSSLAIVSMMPRSMGLIRVSGDGGQLSRATKRFSGRGWIRSLIRLFTLSHFQATPPRVAHAVSADPMASALRPSETWRGESARLKRAPGDPLSGDGPPESKADWICFEGESSGARDRPKGTL